MTESNPQPEKPKDPLRFSQEQYDMLKRCSDKKDMTEWNEWRQENPNEDILLEAAVLSKMYLDGVLLNAGMTKNAETEGYEKFDVEVHLENANLEGASLRGANITRANLENAKLQKALIKGADFTQARLRGAQLDEKEFLKEHHFNKSLYEMLLRCSDNNNITEWNEWRLQKPEENILLRGAYLENCHLQGAYLNSGRFEDKTGRSYTLRGEVLLDWASFNRAHLENVWLQRAYIRKAILRAYLQGAKLWFANLEGTDLWRAHIEDTDFYGANLQDRLFNVAQVDGRTLIAQCEVDKYTDFAGVALDNACIEPGLRQLLEYNIRRIGWEKWYDGLQRLDWHRHGLSDRHESSNANKLTGRKLILRRAFSWPVRLFWSLSDYGFSTRRIIGWFFGLAFIFALVYWLLPHTIMVNCKVGKIRGLWHALYFSVVTMTTLGFGDIAANPDSWLGQMLLMLQVILGYVLLGALVTRFAVLFTAGGPAGKFADEKTIWQRLKQLWNRIRKD